MHTVQVFGIVNQAEIDVFLEFPCFLYDPMDGENLTLVPLTFLNPAVHLEVLSSCTAEA